MAAAAAAAVADAAVAATAANVPKASRRPWKAPTARPWTAAEGEDAGSPRSSRTASRMVSPLARMASRAASAAAAVAAVAAASGRDRPQPEGMEHHQTGFVNEADRFGAVPDEIDTTPTDRQACAGRAVRAGLVAAGRCSRHHAAGRR